MPVHVLAAGDHFLLPSLLVAALREELGTELGSELGSGVGTDVGTDVEIRELMLPWPVQPFGPVAEVDEASGTEDQLIEALDGVDICVTQMAPLTERVLAASPQLKLFCVGRGGPVNANLAAATRHGVAVTFAPGRNAVATAEHAVAMMLAVLRRIPQTHQELLSGTWRGDHYRYEEVGGELAGSTVGILGLGAIGRRVARIVHGFGAHALAFDPYVPAGDPDAPAELVDLEELLTRSTVLSLHARATPETDGIIGAAEIAAMPRGAVLVNCARGALLDYDAVCDALDSGHLGGAAFDVFPEEPLPPDSRLRTTPNVVLTPHVAGASREAARNAARTVAADVGRYLRGERPLHLANPDVLET